MAAQKRPELENRNDWLGGSEAAAAIGVSHWQTPVDVWMRKTDRSSGIEDTDVMRRGRGMEDFLAAEYTAMTGRKVRRCKAYYTSRLGCMRGHPDRICVGIKRGVECKTAGPFTKHLWGEEGSDDVPIDYLVQCHFYMIVTGFPVWDLIVFFDTHDVRVYTIHRDMRLHDRIIKQCAEFWRHVVNDTPPPPVNLEDTKKLWPESVTNKCVMATPQVLNSVEAVMTANEELRTWRELKEQHQFIIRQHMEDGELLVDAENNELAVCRMSTRKHVDLGALRANHPDLVERHTKQVPTRRLTMK